MKFKFTVSILLFSFFINSYSQTKSEIIFVDGVCGMCESRIEMNTLKVKGVKLADWNMENRSLKIVYNEKKISINEIHKFISSIGHDTEKEIAPKEAYKLLDPCCQYRDLQVIKDHGFERNPLYPQNKKEQ